MSYLSGGNPIDPISSSNGRHIMSTQPQSQRLSADYKTADPNPANPSSQVIQALVSGMPNSSPHLNQILITTILQQAISQVVNEDATSHDRPVCNLSNHFGLWNAANNTAFGGIEIVGRQEQKKANSESSSSIPAELLSPQSNNHTVNVKNDYCLGNDGHNCTYRDIVITQEGSDRTFASAAGQSSIPRPNGNAPAPRSNVVRKIVNEDNIGCILSTGSDSSFCSVTIRGDGVQAGFKDGGRAPSTADAASWDSSRPANVKAGSQNGREANSGHQRLLQLSRIPQGLWIQRTIPVIFRQAARDATSSDEST
ncbi:hypothetical protein V5O48_014262 [Marasmius crinis-equi]|uniref:Uncharacterized protein n=1 Tax=Marasmius crinis-equi TaxID=585013 RepID=A0ABR3EY55_9AGAR